MFTSRFELGVFEMCGQPRYQLDHGGVTPNFEVARHRSKAGELT